MALIVFVGRDGDGIFFLRSLTSSCCSSGSECLGALYGVVKAEHPSFEVRIQRKDILGIAAFDVVLLVLLFAYTRLKPM